MIGLRSFIAGLFGALACVASAYAADMPGAWAPPPAYVAPRYTELMSGWYLRLDGGYGWNKVKSVDSITPVVRADYASAPDITVGFGYKFQWIRFDLTFDRGFPSRFDGFTGLPVPQPQYKAKIGWMTALGNAYIDLGTWWGFTPYVGGGIGATRINSKKYTDSSLIFSAHGSPESQSTNFSWAAMAGVSFQVAPNWAIDFGVRHLELARFPTPPPRASRWITPRSSTSRRTKSASAFASCSTDPHRLSRTPRLTRARPFLKSSGGTPLPTEGLLSGRIES